MFSSAGPFDYTHKILPPPRRRRRRRAAARKIRGSGLKVQSDEALREKAGRALALRLVRLGGSTTAAPDSMYILSRINIG